MHTHINIHINEIKVTLEGNQMTGALLKKKLGIQEEVKLYKKIPHAPDEEIINSQTYLIVNGETFFSDDFNKEIKIFIDQKEYQLSKSVITGAELKALAGISAVEYKLLKEVKHGGADEVIEDNVAYEIENKDEFFSVPTGIQNGGTI